MSNNSLCTVVQNATAIHIEPLPPYRRDPETSSIRSSAPSYVSEAPTYHSTNPSSPLPHATSSVAAAAVQSGTQTERIGLPPANYAPGFQHFRNLDRNGLTHLNFSINQWSSVYSSPQAQHYHNVAARRTNLAMIEEQNLFTTLTRSPSNQPIQILPPITSSSSSSISTTTSPSPSSLFTINNNPSTPSPRTTLQPTTTTITTPPPTAQTTQQPINTAIESPLEDPDLVGHAAALATRERRLYITHELQASRVQEAEREAAALREESRRWDFLLAQMADWEERKRGWKVLSRRIDAKSSSSSAAAAGKGSKSVLWRFWK